MTNINMPAPKSGGLLITHWCNAECKHCYLQCSKRKPGKMRLEDAHAHLKEFHSANIPQKEVHITGGEPFGNFKYLLEVLESIRGTGYERWGFVETNAFWAINDKVCRSRLEAVKSSGATGLCISSDIFHQEFVPIENVKRLIENSYRILGPDSVLLRWKTGLTHEKHVGQMTPKEIEDYLLNPLKDFRVRLVGRGSTALKDYLPKKPADQYQNLPCFDKIVGAGHYHFDWHNNLVPGIGCVILGNSAQGKLQKIIADVNEKDNYIFHWLSTEGPSGRLLDYAKSRGYNELEAGYGDKCQLCFDIRRWLMQARLANFEIGPEEIFRD